MNTKIISLCLMIVSLAACGSATDNIDILNSTTLPTIAAFTSTGAYNAGVPFTASNPYWTFNTSSYGNFLAPARGIVAEVGASSIILGSSFVTIIHSGRIATRVHGITSLNVRSGDAVAAGSAVGVFFNSTSIAFQVLLDGTSVCPLSFVSASLRAGLFTNPCQ